MVLDSGHRPRNPITYPADMSTRLKQYRGPLTPEEASNGIALARKNAARLLADAELLLGAERHPSASALAILAIEEIGKVQIIKRIALHTTESDLKAAWKEYRSHRAKNVMWILPKLAAEGARTMQQLKDATDIDGEHTEMLDAVKQLSFYTDCFGENGRWSEPGEAVDLEFAPAILAVAKILTREEQTTVRELQLWVQYVRPHYGKPSMAGAMIAFQHHLFQEGLTMTAPEALELFMRGRSSPVNGVLASD